MTFNHVPNQMVWSDWGALNDFGERDPFTGTFAMKYQFAPPTMKPGSSNDLALVRVPPTEPRRLERCYRLKEGSEPFPVTAVLDVPEAFGDMMQWGLDYGPDLFAPACFWVDPRSLWVYAWVATDVCGLRRWVHPDYKQFCGPLWQSDIADNHELIQSIWGTNTAPGLTSEDIPK